MLLAYIYIHRSILFILIKGIFRITRVNFITYIRLKTD